MQRKEFLLSFVSTDKRKSACRHTSKRKPPNPNNAETKLAAAVHEGYQQTSLPQTAVQEGFNLWLMACRSSAGRFQPVVDGLPQQCMELI